MRHDLTAIEGIYPILYAFFDAEERLDLAAMRRQIDACLAHNPQGIAALGLATEVAKLSTAERRQVMDLLAEQVGDQCPMAITIAEPTVEGQIEFAPRGRRVADRLGHPAAAADFGIVRVGIPALLRTGRRCEPPAGRNPERAGADPNFAVNRVAARAEPQPSQRLPA